MGNMATALARGFVASGKVQAGELYAFDPAKEKLAQMAAELGFAPVGSEKELADAGRGFPRFP